MPNLVAVKLTLIILNRAILYKSSGAATRQNTKIDQSVTKTGQAEIAHVTFGRIKNYLQKAYRAAPRIVEILTKMLNCDA